MPREWNPTDGVIIPSGAKSFAQRGFKGQLFCPGRMESGPLLRQDPNPLLPKGPRHKYRGAPTQSKCGSRRFVLSIHERDLYIVCDECGAHFDILKLAP